MLRNLSVLQLFVMRSVSSTRKLRTRKKTGTIWQARAMTR